MSSVNILPSTYLLVCLTHPFLSWYSFTLYGFVLLFFLLFFCFIVIRSEDLRTGHDSGEVDNQVKKKGCWGTSSKTKFGTKVYPFNSDVFFVKNGTGYRSFPFSPDARRLRSRGSSDTDHVGPTHGPRPDPSGLPCSRSPTVRKV